MKRTITRMINIPLLRDQKDKRMNQGPTDSTPRNPILLDPIITRSNLHVFEPEGSRPDTTLDLYYHDQNPQPCRPSILVSQLDPRKKEKKRTVEWFNVCYLNVIYGYDISGDKKEVMPIILGKLRD